MTVTVIGASIYSMSKGQEMAHEIEYSEGTVVRVIQDKAGWIRCEYKDKFNCWIETKRYKVLKNKKRNGEGLIEIAKAFLA